MFSDTCSSIRLADIESTSSGLGFVLATMSRWRCRPRIDQLYTVLLIACLSVSFLHDNQRHILDYPWISNPWGHLLTTRSKSMACRSASWGYRLQHHRSYSYKNGLIKPTVPVGPNWYLPSNIPRLFAFSNRSCFQHMLQGFEFRLIGEKLTIRSGFVRIDRSKEFQRKGLLWGPSIGCICDHYRYLLVHIVSHKRFWIRNVLHSLDPGNIDTKRAISRFPAQMVKPGWSLPKAIFMTLLIVQKW